LIPQSEWLKTPVFIKATAGMRLVTDEQARVIYDTIYTHLTSSPDICPFSVKRSDLKTISGTEEGYFGALSANYLSGVIDSSRQVLHHQGGVLGALDLGGSSTQVSLYSASGANPVVEQDNFFVHSFLGFGVEKMAERYNTYLESSGMEQDPCNPKDYKNSIGLVGSGDYFKCKQVLSSALKLECSDGSRCVMDGVSLPPVQPSAKFIGMSVYFFALRSLFLTSNKAALTQHLTWPSPTLSELSKAGNDFCGMSWSKLEDVANMDGWEGFMGDAEQRKAELPQRCIQSAFIDVLLGDVYGVPRDERNVMVALDINSMEVEWTLGSVIASPSDDIELLTEPPGLSFDTRLISLCVFLTIIVAAFVCRSALGRRPSKDKGSRAWPSILAASFTSKAAFIRF